MMKNNYVLPNGYPFENKIKNLEAMSMEILEDGNIQVLFMAPCIIDKEKNSIDGDWNTYIFERKGKCAMYVSTPFSKMEFIVNPNYYNDNRFNEFLSKKEIIVYFYLVDTYLEEVVGFAMKKMSERTRMYFGKALTTNSSYSRE